MPGRRARRSALLLPLSLALCGDSMSLRGGGCGPGPPNPEIIVDLACSIEARGAVVRTFPCAGTWRRYPGDGGRWSLSMDTRGGILLPHANLYLTLPAPGQLGLTYVSQGAPPADLLGGAGAKTVGGQDYCAYWGSQGSSDLGQVTLSFTSLAPLAGTFEATLPPDPWSSLPGPAGTNVVLTGTFWDP